MRWSTSRAIWRRPLRDYQVVQQSLRLPDSAIENGAMIFEKKVQPRPSAGIARRPFFATDVVEFQHEEGVHEILQIVLILDLKGGAAGMPRTKLTRDEVYS